MSLSYREFAEQLINERLQSEMPPFSYLALLQVDSPQKPAGHKFAENVFQLALSIKNSNATAFAGIQLLGPMPAPMEKRAGRFRFHLLIKSHARSDLQKYLSVLSGSVEGLKPVKQTRWSLDVDPIDLI